LNDLSKAKRFEHLNRRPPLNGAKRLNEEDMGNKRPMHRHSNEFKRPDLNSFKIDQTIRILEKDWKRACHIFNQKEKVFVDTYLGFLRSVAGFVCKRAGGSGSGRIRLCTGARADLATCQFLLLDDEKPVRCPSFLLKSNS